MARQNGQATFITIGTPGPINAAAANIVQACAVWERMTVVEVGAINGNQAVPPGANFAFTVSKRSNADTSGASDVVIPVFKAAFAAEGGPGGDSSNLNFDNANQIPNGIITNTQNLLIDAKCLRAYCEETFDKGDQIIFTITSGGTSSSTVFFYAKTYLDGAGLIESNDVDSN